jgi:hypothetical protein
MYTAKFAAGAIEMVTITKKQISTKIASYLLARRTKIDKRLCESIEDMMYGLLSYGSTRVSEMARNHPKSKKKADRLFQMLKKYYYFLKHAQIPLETLWEAHLEQTGREIGERPVILIDYTAIEKKYSRKVENLQYVWDGMQKKAVRGIKVLVSCGLSRRGTVRMFKLVPSSSREEGFKSENNEVVGMILSIRRYVCKQALYVMDRGMDHRKIMEPLIEAGVKFLIRLRTGRNGRYLEDIRSGRVESVGRMIEGDGV